MPFKSFNITIIDIPVANFKRRAVGTNDTTITTTTTHAGFPPAKTCGYESINSVALRNILFKEFVYKIKYNNSC